MIACPVHPRCRYKHGKFGQEILFFEHDSAGSVSPPTFQPVEEAAVRQRGQTFRGHSRPGCISAQSLQAHAVARFDADVGVHAEAGDHSAAGTLEGIQAVAVDLISQTYHTAAGIGTNRDPSIHRTGQESCHAGIVVG